MKHIVLLDIRNNETYEQYYNSMLYVTPNVCVCKNWGGTTIYYEEEIVK